MQFIFLDQIRFHIPVAHFQVTLVQAHHLFFNFWELVDMLDNYGFNLETVVLMVLCQTDNF